jgi:hypothetical protein
MRDNPGAQYRTVAAGMPRVSAQSRRTHRLAGPRHGLVTDEPKQPTIEFSAMPGEQHLHGKLVARLNALNQNFVGGISN